MSSRLSWNTLASPSDLDLAREMRERLRTLFNVGAEFFAAKTDLFGPSISDIDLTTARKNTQRFLALPIPLVTILKDITEGEYKGI